jgi:hypothetical protein
LSVRTSSTGMLLDVRVALLAKAKRAFGRTGRVRPAPNPQEIAWLCPRTSIIHCNHALLVPGMLVQRSDLVASSAGRGRCRKSTSIPASSWSRCYISSSNRRCGHSGQSTHPPSCAGEWSRWPNATPYLVRRRRTEWDTCCAPASCSRSSHSPHLNRCSARARLSSSRRCWCWRWPCKGGCAGGEGYPLPVHPAGLQ